jgi:hypothetical protein
VPELENDSYRGVLWANLVSLVILLWIGVRFLAVAIEARGRTAALLAVPPWYLYAPALLIGAAFLVVGLIARLKRLPPQRRVYRLLPVLSVVLLGVHVFVVPPCLLPFAADEIVVAELASVEGESLADQEGYFLADPGPLAAATERFSPPFVDANGEPLAHWRVVTSAGCQGPLATAPVGTEAGALLWCVSADRAHAWLTAVGLGAATTGAPAVVKSNGEPAVFAFERSAPIPTSPDSPDAGLPHGADGAIE